MNFYIIKQLKFKNHYTGLTGFKKNIIKQQQK